jgi:hypothetical protein
MTNTASVMAAVALSLLLSVLGATRVPTAMAGTTTPFGRFGDPMGYTEVPLPDTSGRKAVWSRR